MKNMKEYRINFKKLIIERRLSITKVSKDTGISRTTLTGLYYRPGRGIQIKTLNTLCNYLNITPGELFTEVQPIKPVYPQRKKAAIKKITAI